MATNKRGGPRHFPKPMMESGLLFQVFCKHTELVQNLKAYEHLSSGSTPDPKGMHYCLALVNELLELSPQAELHPQPLRDALLRLLSSKPLLNNTGHAGQVWVHQRADRVNVLLAHIRKLARSGPTARCAGNLTGLEFSQLQDTLKKVQLRPGEPLQKGALPLGNGDDEAEERPAKKKLKKNDSDVSLDSAGFPMMLKTPENEKKLLQIQAGSCKRGWGSQCPSQNQHMRTSKKQWV